MAPDPQASSDSDETVGFFELLKIWYHIPLLATLMAFMYRVRVTAAFRFIVDGERVFKGNDAWYHYRQVVYTVKHWPNTMPYDIWTRFPVGTHVGQFGTLYDQIVATAALIIGFGSPSEQVIANTLFYAPAVFGTLLAIPVYYLGSRLAAEKTDSSISYRVGGVFSVLLLALYPGTILQRSLVGFSDHNIVEPFFLTAAVVALFASFRKATENPPITDVYEYGLDVDHVKPTIMWSVIAGALTTLYIFVWPPGIFVLGLLGLFLFIRINVDHYRSGEVPEALGSSAIVTSITVGVLSLVATPILGFSITKISLFHPIAAFGLAAGVAFLIAHDRYWDPEYTPLYPVINIALIALGAALFAVVAPNAFQRVIKKLMFTFGLGVSGQKATIAEAASIFSQAYPRFGYTVPDILMREYGFSVFTGFAGLLYMAVNTFRNRTQHYHQFFLVLAVAFTLMAFSQVRYNYYLAVIVAAANAYTIRCAISFLETDTPTGPELSRSSTAILIVGTLLVLTPLIVPMPVASAGGSSITTSNVVTVANSNAPQDIKYWDPALDYLRTQTPEEGTFAGADNPLKLYGTYSRPDGGDYSYPDGTYGVLSWWDYGHWITTQGERIPNANPFQEGSVLAAEFFLSQKEETANKKLQTVHRNDDPGAKTRYVMIDWRMATVAQKFSAMATFKRNASMKTYADTVYLKGNKTLRRGFMLKKQAYYESMVTRLYHFHGSAVTPKPVVVDWETTTLNGRTFKIAKPGGEAVKKFENMSAARKYAENTPTAKVGGVGVYPNERVSALEHYRLVNSTRLNAFNNPRYMQSMQKKILMLGMKSLISTNPSWVKTFERVPGAKIQGTAPPNTTVRATVFLTEGEYTDFTYVQYAKTGPDGTFTMTLPYSSTGYKKYGPENGYTNVSVQASGPYNFTVVGSNTTVQKHVPEGYVNGDVDSTIHVDLLTDDESAGSESESESESDSSN